MATPKAQRTRELILDAARELVRREGIAYLSLDKVATASGLSKGAVTYHFKTRRDLDEALIADYAAFLDSSLKRFITRQIELGAPDEASALIPAYAEWFRDFVANGHDRAILGVELLSQQAHDPEIVQPVRNWYASLVGRVNALPMHDRAKMLVAIMAFEGLFFTRKFGLDTIGEDQRREILDYLVNQFNAN
jgi:AcrR family transcriptional regulator